jgi:hypothetical protein
VISAPGALAFRECRIFSNRLNAIANFSCNAKKWANPRKSRCQQQLHGEPTG